MAMMVEKEKNGAVGERHYRGLANCRRHALLVQWRELKATLAGR